MAAEPVSEEIIISRAQAGEAEAQEILFSRYKPLVLSRAHAFFLAGGDSEDLVQEGMIGLYKAMRFYDKNKNSAFASFADLCIRRQIYSAVKASKRKKNAPLNESVSLDKPPSEDSDPLLSWVRSFSTEDPEQLIIGMEGYRELSAAIQTELSKMEKRVLSGYLRGLSYQQIAEEMGVGIKSVDNAIQRLKRKLEKYL